VGEDPYTRFIEANCKENAGDEDGAIFVVAAGNAGADGYTIGSPGVSPKALTVGSWSLSDNSPAIFSSRGPQGAHYKDNQEQFQEDLSEFGADEFVKPDVVAPGGGRENAAKTDDADELLFQTSTGWYDGLRDGVKDGRANMKGTSMATPAVAGLVKRLYDAGIVTTAADVKQVVSERGGVGEYPDAAPGANETVEGKNIAAGFGVIRESLFDPDTE
jgi:subtilisin family serine protease